MPVEPQSIHKYLITLWAVALQLTCIADEVESVSSTVSEAVSQIIQGMSDEERISAVRMSENEYVAVENGFGLGLDRDLWTVCGEDVLPEKCSSIVFRRVWAKLFNVVDHEYWVKEQRTHSALQEVRVQPSDYKGRNAGEILSQLRRDLSRSAVPGANEISILNRCVEREEIIPWQRLDVDWSSPVELIAWTTNEMGCGTSVVESTVFIEPH